MGGGMPTPTPSSNTAEPCHLTAAVARDILVDSMVTGFFSSSEYPPQFYERVFGVQMTSPQAPPHGELAIGKLVFLVWRGLMMTGDATADGVKAALRAGRLPAYFEERVRAQSEEYFNAGTYLPDLMRRGFAGIPWDTEVHAACRSEAGPQPHQPQQPQQPPRQEEEEEEEEETQDEQQDQQHHQQEQQEQQQAHQAPLIHCVEIRPPDGSYQDFGPLREQALTEVQFLTLTFGWFSRPTPILCEYLDISLTVYSDVSNRNLQVTPICTKMCADKGTGLYDPRQPLMRGNCLVVCDKGRRLLPKGVMRQVLFFVEACMDNAEWLFPGCFALPDGDRRLREWGNKFQQGVWGCPQSRGICSDLDCLKATDGRILRCSKCQEATYCDKACQRHHWKLHKPCCSPAWNIQWIIH